MTKVSELAPITFGLPRVEQVQTRNKVFIRCNLTVSVHAKVSHNNPISLARVVLSLVRIPYPQVVGVDNVSPRWKIASVRMAKYIA